MEDFAFSLKTLNVEGWLISSIHNYIYIYMKVFPSRTPSKLIWVVWDPAKDTQISRKIGVLEINTVGETVEIQRRERVRVPWRLCILHWFLFFPTCFCAQVCCVYLQRGERLRNWSHNLWHPFDFDETILRDIRCFGPFFLQSGLQFETISQCYQRDNLLNNLTYMSSYKSE